MATTGRRPAYNRKMYSGQTYVYGNTVRKPDMVLRRQETFVPDRPKKVSRQVRQNRREAMHMNAAYVVFLAIAAVIALFVCVNYLQLRSELRSHSNNITMTIHSIQKAGCKNGICHCIRRIIIIFISRHKISLGIYSLFNCMYIWMMPTTQIPLIKSNFYFSFQM
mgnify:CR=1 FL=1